MYLIKNVILVVELVINGTVPKVSAHISLPSSGEFAWTDISHKLSKEKNGY